VEIMDNRQVLARAVTDDLLIADATGHRPSLENRVAYQWRQSLDSLGSRSGVLRDSTILSWMSEALKATAGPYTVLDIGSAFGNHLLMLDAYLDHPSDLRLIGIDLSPDKIAFANHFASHIPRYGNCQFQVGDIEQGLEFDDGTFQVVNLADVLEHLEDPLACLVEIHRITAAGGTVVISTPQPKSIIKQISRIVDRLTEGRVSRRYYAGKAAALDEAGRPIMDVDAGHAHVSEMGPKDLTAIAEKAGFSISEIKPMTVMSGSAWFDRHPLLLAALLVLEAIHLRLGRPTWAHGVCYRLVRRPA
jgi:SAM-dependent methyltransferase